MHDKVLERDFVLKAFKDTLKVIQQEPPSVRRSLRRSQTEKQRRRHSHERDQLVAKMERALRWFETENLAVTRRRREVITPDEEPFLPRDRTLSLFQSTLDSYLTELQTKRRLRLRTTRAPVGSFEPTDPGWISVVWEKLRVQLGRGVARFKSHKKITDFMFPLEDSCSIALVGDWGTGIQRALAVAKEIEKQNAKHAIHLGDVYYSGTEEEIAERFLAHWPKNVGHSWALNSNHEMYSGGHGYFKVTLKKFKQPASYFCLRNNNWQLIGLDTGYVDHNLNREQFEWLLNKLKNYNGKTILLSHHQLFSAFESQGENLEAWLDKLLDEGKIYAWFWGHEHRCIVYKPHKNIKARCLGHGGVPYKAHAERQTDIPIEWVDEREHPQRPGWGMFGFALLNLEGSNLHVRYIDEFGKIPWEEEL